MDATTIKTNRNFQAAFSESEGFPSKILPCSIKTICVSSSEALVIKHLTEGLDTKKVSAVMFLSKNTIDRYVGSIKKQIGWLSKFDKGLKFAHMYKEIHSKFTGKEIDTFLCELSHAEKETLHLIVQYKTVAKVSEVRGVTIKTTETHLYEINNKLGVKSMFDLGVVMHDYESRLIRSDVRIIVYNKNKIIANDYMY